MIFTALFPFLFGCRSIEEQVEPAEADLVIVVEKAMPMERPVKGRTAIVVRNGRILEIAGERGIKRFLGGKTRIVEFKGGYLYPGLVDAHAHTEGLGKSLDMVDLRGAESFEAVIERVKRKARTTPRGKWIIGRGWDQNLWKRRKMPDRVLLSREVPDHPVWLKRIDGHAGLANSMAMRIAGLDKNTMDVKGGKIFRFEDGSPTGLLLDNAMDLIERAIPEESGEEVERNLLLAQERCMRCGLTRIHDAAIRKKVYAALNRLEKEGKWKIGIYGMLLYDDFDVLPPVDDPGPRARLRFRAVKFFADGALGSRGAALLEPYSDDPGNTGLLTLDPAGFREKLKKAVEKGYQPCTHAIGDRAVRMVLDTYQRVMDEKQRKRLRPRIEHAQVVAREDIPRFKRLGIIASMQPTHLTTDMAWAPSRLGPERIKGAYAFKTFMDLGTSVCFGSDFPVERVSPLRGIFAAITTRPPEEPWKPPYRKDQMLDPGRALLGFTLGAAYAAFEEKVRGRLEPGFQADFTILDADILEAKPEEILKAKVFAVVIGGEIFDFRK